MAYKQNIRITRLIKSLISTIDNDVKISNAYLFGSYAKGTANKWSDIDLALVSPEFKGIRFYDSKKLIPYLRGCPEQIEVHPIKKSDFEKPNLFVKEIIKTGIKIK